VRKTLLIAVLMTLPMAGVARASEAPSGSSPAPSATPPPEPSPLISGNRIFFGGGISDLAFILGGIALNGGGVVALGVGPTYDSLATPRRFSVTGVFYASYAVKNVAYFAMGPEVFFLTNLGANPASTFTIRPGYALWYSSAALPVVLVFGLDVDLNFTDDHFRFGFITPGLRFAFGI
jgi:hypothetical protein